jgi:hypothetical protein
MSFENPLWALPRSMELLKLGINVAQSTVLIYMAGTWRPARDGV